MALETHMNVRVLANRKYILNFSPNFVIIIVVAIRKKLWSEW
jgi:hypothetical protein